MTKGELLKALEGFPDDMPVRFGKGLRDSISLSGVEYRREGDYEDGMVTFPENSQHHYRKEYIRLTHSSEQMLIWAF